MNTLTIFSPRTGSTIITELLAFQNRNIALDEFTSGALRHGTLFGYVIGIPKHHRDHIIEMIKRDSSFGLNRERIDYVLGLDKPWSAKCIAREDNRLSEYFIEKSLEQRTKLYYTSRRDIKAQCWSMIMAVIRNEHRTGPESAFVSVNSLNYPEVKPFALDAEKAESIVDNILSSNREVEYLYNKFGGTRVVYEDSVQRQDFSVCGIDQTVISKYRTLKTRLEKPDKITPDQYFTNWESIDILIERKLNKH